MLLFEIKSEETELREQGLTPDEITDAIAHRGKDRRVAHSPLLDNLIGEDAAAERKRLLLEAADDDEAEDDEAEME